jgi:hypothetical protein
MPRGSRRRSTAIAADGARFCRRSDDAAYPSGTCDDDSVKDLTSESAISAGGWDPRYAVTLAIGIDGNLAAALVDTNGDGADIDLDEYERDTTGHWQEMGSGSAGDFGASWSPRMVAAWGRGAPHEQIEIGYINTRRTVAATDTGWWLCVMPTEDDHSYPQQVHHAGSTSSPLPVALRSKRWQRKVWRWPTRTPPIVAPSAPPIFSEPIRRPEDGPASSN